MKAEKPLMAVSHIESLTNLSTDYFWLKGRRHWITHFIKSAEFAFNLQSKSYLDLGCGNGQFASELQEEFEFQRVGLVEADHLMMKQKIQISNAVWYDDFLGSDFKLPFAAELITMMDVLEHLEQDEAFLKNIFDQMPKKSMLALSVPALQSFYTEWDRNLGHFRRYSKAELTQKLAESGFMVFKISYAWSFLSPAILLRKWKEKKQKMDMEFQSVSPTLNHLLWTLSKAEFRLSEKVPIPFGTSLYALGVKL